MSFFDFFKNLFGNSENTNNRERVPNRNNYRNEFLNPDTRYEDSRRSDDEESDNISKFNIFTDPLEMHRYFEEQMNDLFKSFGIFGSESNSFFGDLPSFNPPSGFDVPQLEPPPQSDLRSHLLKPGYEHSVNKTIDSDLDGKVEASDLDMLYKDRVPNDSVQKQKLLIPQVKSFGQSITSKTIRGPDGSYETHRTVRDSAGNEETTITRQLGGKQYSITIRTDKNGMQEKIEDMKNIEEKELSQFTDNWRPLEMPKLDQGVDWNKMFDTFFK